MSGGLLAAATLTGGYAAIWPRISIEPPPDIVDPLAENVFPLPFKLTNLGYLSIYDVSVTCTPNLIGPMTPEQIFKLNHKIPFTVFDVEIRKVAFTVPKIVPQERRSFICDVWNRNTSYPQTLSRAELGMEISFRPINIIPWKITSRILFHTNTTEKGKLHWVEPSLDQFENEPLYKKLPRK